MPKRYVLFIFLKCAPEPLRFPGFFKTKGVSSITEGYARNKKLEALLKAFTKGERDSVAFRQPVMIPESPTVSFWIMPADISCVKTVEEKICKPGS